MSLLLPRRCPQCQVLNAPDQNICLRCFEPLPPAEAGAPVTPITNETCKLYRAQSSGATLLLARTLLEYDAPTIAFDTPWDNVAAIAADQADMYLRLYHTPHVSRMPLGTGRSWFSDLTMAIPLGQFGAPANQDLLFDLMSFAPQLRRARY